MLGGGAEGVAVCRQDIPRDLVRGRGRGRGRARARVRVRVRVGVHADPRA